MKAPALVACGWVVVAAAWAESAPLLGPSAFRSPAACALDPFDALDAVQLDTRLRARCDAAPDGRGLSSRQGWERRGGRAETWVGQALVWGTAALHARLHVDAAARLEQDSVSARTQVAAGLWLQPDARWAVNARLGGRLFDGGAIEQHWSMTGAWKPADDHLLFTRWRASGEVGLHEIGMRWWLLPRHISFDAVLPTDVGQDHGSAKLLLSWRGFRL